MNANDLKSKLRIITDEIQAEERRNREALAKIEARKVALIRQGRAHYRQAIDGYRSQACSFLEAAAQRLDAVGPAPVKPDLADLDASGDLDAYLAAVEAHGPAKAEHEKASREAATPLVAQIQGLHRLARNAARECRETGFGGEDFHLGVGIVPEHVHRYQDGTARLDALLIAADAGALTADECRAMVEILSTPEPEHRGLVNGSTVHLRDSETPAEGTWVQRKWVELTNGIERLVKPAPVYSQTNADADQYVRDHTGGLPLAGDPRATAEQRAVRGES